MSLETDTLLRAIVFQALSAKDLPRFIYSLKAICSKDLFAAVEKEYEEMTKSEDEAK